MAQQKGRPPGKPKGERKVISIVEELERRQMARMRDLATAKHLRELESSLDLVGHTTALREMDLDAELAKIGPLPPAEARIQRASIRAARALQSCLNGDPDAGFAEWAEVIAQVPEVAHTYLVRARWLMQSDPSAAVADYDRAATIEPTNPTVYCRRGDCYATLGDQDRALANYRRALALDPSLFDVHYAVAKILAARGAHAEAVGAFDRAIALAPRYADFHLGRAQALEHLGDFEGAVRDHGRILDLDPSRNDVRFYRAMCLYRGGHAGRAIEELSALTRIEPDDQHNHRILGKIRVEAGQHDLAILDLTRAIEIDPHEPLSYAHRGRAHWENGDRDRALADFDRAIALKSDEPEFHLGRAKALASLDLLADALESTDRALALSPSHPFAHVMRAVYRSYQHGEKAYPEVLADLTRAVELEPDNAAFRRQRGEYLMEFQECTAALLDLERALVLAPDAASLYYDRGYCKSHLDEHLMDHDDHWEEDEDTRARCLSAVADFEKAIALGLCHEDLYSELWNAYCQMHDDAMARRSLDRGCEAVPDSAILFYWRHTHRKHLGDLEGAAADRARAAANGFKFRDEPTPPEEAPPKP